MEHTYVGCHVLILYGIHFILLPILVKPTKFYRFDVTVISDKTGSIRHSTRLRCSDEYDSPNHILCSCYVYRSHNYQ